WGASGEKWNPAGRLPDFSYAGYHAGEANIPNAPAKWDLKRDFHARGDGHTDDSTALLNAIQSIDAGVLFIPEGTYVITRRIDISKGNFVLRGAGPHKTILLFPNSLTDLFGNKAKGTEQSQWSFRPGLLNITGSNLFRISRSNLRGHSPMTCGRSGLLNFIDSRLRSRSLESNISLFTSHGRLIPVTLRSKVTTAYFFRTCLSVGSMMLRCRTP